MFLKGQGPIAYINQNEMSDIRNTIKFTILTLQNDVLTFKRKAKK